MFDQALEPQRYGVDHAPPESALGHAYHRVEWDLCDSFAGDVDLQFADGYMGREWRISGLRTLARVVTVVL